jgi:hypothetical protein
LPDSHILREKQRKIQLKIHEIRPVDNKRASSKRTAPELCLNLPETFGHSLTRRLSISRDFSSGSFSSSDTGSGKGIQSNRTESFASDRSLSLSLSLDTVDSCKEIVQKGMSISWDGPNIDIKSRSTSNSSGGSDNIEVTDPSLFEHFLVVGVPSDFAEVIFVLFIFALNKNRIKKKKKNFRLKLNK